MNTFLISVNLNRRKKELRKLENGEPYSSFSIKNESNCACWKKLVLIEDWNPINTWASRNKVLVWENGLNCF